MKDSTVTTRKSGSDTQTSSHRLLKTLEEDADTATAAEATENAPHQFTNDGIEYDSDAEVTAVPDMTTPIIKPKIKTTTPTIKSDRMVVLPSSRSQELKSFVGKTIRLELKKKQVVQSLAFISNKGGVGKTHMSSNMAFYLSRIGKKVLLIDLDLGNSDVTNKLGFYCENTILDLLQGKKLINQLTYTTPHGFDLIGGESGNVKLANLNAAQKKRFIRALRELGSDYDYVLYDLSAGIQSTTLDFALAQDFQIVVTTPQDIVAGYSCIKAAYYRFQELERKLAERDPSYKRQTTLRPFVVMNQVPDFETGRQLFEKIIRVAKQNILENKEFFLDINFLGVVTSDQARIRDSELEHYLYSCEHGASRTGQCYNFLVDNLVQYKDPDRIEFTTKLKRFMSILMRSVEETKYAR